MLYTGVSSLAARAISATISFDIPTLHLDAEPPLTLQHEERRERAHKRL